MSRTSTRPLRSVSAMLRGDQIAIHNIIVGVGTIIAGLLGVAFQSIFSHRLQPDEYGGVFVVVSVLSLVGLPASAFSLVMARETSRDRASGQMAPSNTLLREGNRALLLAGLVLAAVLALMSPLLAQFLVVPVNLLLAGIAGIPFTVALPLLLGYFQGEQRFVALAGFSIGLAAFKLVGALAIGAIWGPAGIIAGISIASAAGYVVALGLLSSKMSVKTRLPWFRPATSYLAIILPSTLALAVLLSADVLLVKHFFPTRLAGEYAAVAALGRAIFWGASAIATVLFPKAVYFGAQGNRGGHLVGASLLLAVLGGLVGLGFLTFGARPLLIAFSGASYAGVSDYLPWYGIGMIMLGCAAVLVATHQSRGRRGFLWILLPLTLLEPILLLAFHQDLMQVVIVVDISMLLVAGGLGALYLIQRNILLPDHLQVPESSAVVTKVAGAR